ncbi:hypothetical protein D3C84_716060 [compost metagenome]
MLQVLLALEQARQDQAAENNRQQAANGPQSLAQQLVVRRGDYRQQQDGNDDGAEEVAGNGMAELVDHRLAMTCQLGQVAQAERRECQGGEQADGLADQRADAEVLVGQAPGQAQARQAHDRAEQVDREILDRGDAGRFGLDFFERGNEYGVHGRLRWAGFVVGDSFCHA